MTAEARNKPIHGNYKCSGTTTYYVYVGSIGGGIQPKAVTGKMIAKRGEFEISILTSGWKDFIAGKLSPDASPIVFDDDRNSYGKLGLESCYDYAKLFKSAGNGYQNKTGKKIDFSIDQDYSCMNALSTRYKATYKLSCKR